MLNLRHALVGAAAAMLCYQLVLPPVVALADNGDFGKIIGRFGLWARVHRTYQFSDTVYYFDPARRWVSDFYSTETALARAAIALNSALSKDGAFDIRAIGAIHSALLLLALWLLAPLLEETSRRLRLTLCALILFFFCDPMYTAGLNSFYTDEPAYLFLLLSTVFYLRAIRWRRPADCWALLICILLMLFSKSQHALQALWFAFLLALNRRLLWPYKSKWTAAISVLPVIAALFMVTRGVPRDYVQFSIYNVAFGQILPHARNVDRTLADLGLDASYKPYIGHTAYDRNSPMDDPSFERVFAAHLNPTKLGIFYLLHSSDAWRTLTSALDEAGRQHAFGTFDVSAGYPAGAESRAFRWWSDLKSGLFLQHGHRYFWSVTALSVLFAASLNFLRLDPQRGLVSAGYVLIGMTLTELATDSLLDSMDIVRHYLVFYALLDLMLLAVIALAGRALSASLAPPRIRPNAALAMAAPERPVR
jgi:hypothetical protein